jgi:hypothetical protein
MSGDCRRGKMATEPVKKRNTLYKNAAGALVAAAIVAALFCRKPPQSEPIHDCPTSNCPAPPRDGDGICDAAHGEADPASPTFSRSDCGFCGDGIIQLRAMSGSAPHIDENGRHVQDVTQRPSETPANCPVEFTCGDGRINAAEIYGSYVQRNGRYVLGTVEVTETCREGEAGFCRTDCDAMRHVRVVRRRHSGEDAGAEIADPALFVRCPTQIISPEFSSSARAFQTNVRRGVAEQAAAIRRTLGTSSTSDVVLFIGFGASPTGGVSMQSITVTCDGNLCPSTAHVSGFPDIGISGERIDPPRVSCSWSFPVRVPRL